MNRALAIITVVSLFVAGITIGALGMHLFQDRRIESHGGPHGMRHGFAARRLHRELDLSPDQEKRIEEILARTHEEASALRDNLHPKVQALMDRAHEEIATILTPEQRVRFEDLVESHKRRAERFFLGPPRGRGSHRRHPGQPPPGPPGD